ncbi:suppressor of cytokine signaling 3 isoform X2 [Procambarus clarkii]|nr:suppressor of cytokine signaling 3-like isoform X2 [Procambarus clarkii]XP_045614606.1 suppressor of cytokine signaling 3-like isoform X2 [Procambarus clarkii]XP_045614607.1 suppressor of cytokine signaling 3-like isoform X2 [Procambarus clarkii]
MLTCPNCHHVLAAHSCCGMTLLPPSLQHCPSPPSNTASLASAPPGTLFMGSSLGPVSFSVGSTHQPSPLATPHVSGHMFHFPSVQMASSVVCPSQCHMACHTTAHTQGTCRGACSGMWRWPDSGGQMSAHTVTTRMHTSGGGIVDESAGIKRTLGDIRDSFSSVRDWDDDHVLSATRQALAKSGWYWERLSWREAETLLQSTSLGTFIVRDSADTRFLYSLSVQTERGPTSVRIHYTGGKFRLDCESHMASKVPGFSHVITLIEHYIRLNRKLQRHVWVDAEGKMYSPITIRQPFKRTVPTLKHLSRLAINQSFHRSYSTVCLPPALSQYINEYPFWC